MVGRRSSPASACSAGNWSNKAARLVWVEVGVAHDGAGGLVGDEGLDPPMTQQGADRIVVEHQAGTAEGRLVVEHGFTAGAGIGPGQVELDVVQLDRAQQGERGGTHLHPTRHVLRQPVLGALPHAFGPGPVPVRAPRRQHHAEHDDQAGDEQAASQVEPAMSTGVRQRDSRKAKHD